MREFLTGRRPTPAMAVAFIALLAALSGTAVALPGKNSVNSGDIKNKQVKGKDLANNAVTSAKVKNNAVTSAKVKNNAITGADVQDDSLTGADVSESTLGQVPSANSSSNADNLGGKPSSAYASSTSEAYHEVGAAGEPAFENSWVNFAPGVYSTAGFYRDSEGLVHLKGTIDDGLNGSPAFTLPAGYRPSSILFLPMAGGGPVAANLQIGSDGTVSPTCDTAACPSGFDGLIFRAGVG